MKDLDIIRMYLNNNGYTSHSDETRSHIDKWLEWYQGDVEKFHKYKIYNGSVMTLHDRYRMGMAKKICEDWANLLLNEKVAIKAGDYEKRLNEILASNNFRVKSNQLVELTFALGTGAFVEYKDKDGNVVIDYIRADMIYPISWDNGDITECAFGTVQTIEGKETIYLQIHRLGKEENSELTKMYYIENKYVDAKSGEDLSLSDDIEEIVKTEYDKPLFQIITPNICNNIDLNSPLGISVYANSISQLKGCDIVYDSYVNEYILGRKRIIVPISMARMQMEEDGVATPVFDSEDTVYYMMPNNRQSDMKLTEVDMTIRASDHELGIQRSLDILSLNVGMGTGRYKFDSSGGVKTATEVISDKSDLYQNRQKHSIIMAAALTGMACAVAFLDTGAEIEVTIDFDDSIIDDINATIEKNIKLVNGGLRSKLTAIMEINKCDDTAAKKELALIAEDGKIIGQNIDWTQMDDDESDVDENSKEGEAEDESSEKPASGRAN